MSLNPIKEGHSLPETPWRVALAGNPNCGKTALFNALTGGYAKVGNYPGVTVERKEGRLQTQEGGALTLLDLPGVYSLDARTPDETVTRDVLLGRKANEKRPDLLIAVVDSTQLDRGLGFVLELKALGVPLVLALNMMDLAKRRGLDVHLETLSQELGIPVVATAATKRQGVSELIQQVETQLRTKGASPDLLWERSTPEMIRKRFAETDRILDRAIRTSAQPTLWTDRIDRIVLHPVWGSLCLFFVFGFMFQAIFTWAQLPMEGIEELVQRTGQAITRLLPEGALQGLLVDGVLAGVGAVLVFLPQIILLFMFILFFEDSGYMARAAFLMDRMMGKVGLNGRAFIPLLSSFACAIPGIMAARTIENRKDRLATILVAPLMTCSARLPIYSLLIAAFIPNIAVGLGLRLQGLVMFSLYLAGIGMALLVALVLRKTLLPGEKPLLLMELPTYKWPNPRNILIGLWDRIRLFVQNAGSVILTVSVILWFFASYPKPPSGALEPAITYSYAGQIGKFLEPLVSPIGFNWKIAVALIPGFAAREVMVSSLATVYAVESSDEGHLAKVLGDRLSQDWTLATALSLLVWYILASQCLSTLAVTKRETNSWRWPLFMLGYMTALAYVCSFITYQSAVKMGWG